MNETKKFEVGQRVRVIANVAGVLHYTGVITNVMDGTAVPGFVRVHVKMDESGGTLSFGPEELEQVT